MIKARLNKHKERRARGKASWNCGHFEHIMVVQKEQ
jgi:hypothetical protein